MSYLLSSNNRRRLGLGRLGLGGRSSCIGDAAPQRHPNRPATSAAMGGAGNGLFTNRPVSGQEQVLIQRTSIGQQQQNSQRENPPQQQQRQRTQQQQSLQRLRSQQQEQVPGEVSMQEEGQQLESERNLQRAHSANLRLLGQQKGLETKLDEVLYQNGQLRAELAHEQQTLSNDLRALLHARSVVERAKDDLHGCDRKIKKSIEMKDIILANHHTLDRLMEEARTAIAKKKLVEKRAKEKDDKASKALEAAKQLSESLRQGIESEAAIKQRGAAQSANIRSRCVELQRTHDAAMQEKESLLSQEENVKARHDDEDARFGQSMAEMAAAEKASHEVLRAMARNKDRLRKEAAAKREQLHRAWTDMVAIQKAEGHKPGLLPSESNEPPLLDIARIRLSLQAELDAVKEEVTTKDELSASLESRQQEQDRLEAEKLKCEAELDELKLSNASREAVESKQATTINKMLAEGGQLDKAIEEKTNLLQDRRLQLDAGAAALTEEIEYVQQKIVTATATRDCLARELETMKASLADKKELHDQLVQDIQATLRAKEAELADASAHNANAQEEQERLCQELLSARYPDLDQKFEAAERQIAEKLEMHPELATATVKYRPDLSEQEQAKIDLKELFDDVKRRGAIVDEKKARLKKKERANRGVEQKGNETELKKKQRIDRQVEQKAAEPKPKQEEKRRSNVVTKSSDGDFEVSAVKPRSLLPTFVGVKDDPPSARAREIDPRSSLLPASTFATTDTDKDVSSSVPGNTSHSKNNPVNRREASNKKHVRWAADVNSAAASQDPIEESPTRKVRQEFSLNDGSKISTGSNDRKGSARGSLGNSSNDKAKDRRLSSTFGAKADIGDKPTKSVSNSSGAVIPAKKASRQDSDGLPVVSSKTSSAIPPPKASKTQNAPAVKSSSGRLSKEKVTQKHSSRPSGSVVDLTSIASSRVKSVTKPQGRPSTAATVKTTSGHLSSKDDSKPSSRSSTVIAAQSTKSSINVEKSSVRSSSGVDDKASSHRAGGVGKSGLPSVSSRSSKPVVTAKPSRPSSYANAEKKSRLSSSANAEKKSNRPEKRSKSNEHRSSKPNPGKATSRPGANKSTGSIKSKGSLKSKGSASYGQFKSTSDCHGKKRASSEQASGLPFGERDPKKRRRSLPAPFGVVKSDQSGFDDDYSFDFSSGY